MKLSDTIVPIISATGLLPGFENYNYGNTTLTSVSKKDFKNKENNGFILNEPDSTRPRRVGDILLTKEQTKLFEVGCSILTRTSILTNQNSGFRFWPIRIQDFDFGQSESRI